MAKKQKDKVRIPKHVAGVKVPKAWREGGEALIAQAQSPAGRAAIAKGVSVVAGLAMTAAQSAAQNAGRSADKKATGVAPPPANAPAKAADIPGSEGTPSPSPSPPADQIAQAVGAGIEAVLGRLFAKR